MIKPIFYFSVMTSNRGDMAIRKSITEAINSYKNVPFAFFNIKTEKITEERIKQLNDEGSCLMIAGSGLYSNANTTSGWYLDCDPELLKLIKVPIILLGLGCNNNLANDIFNGNLTNKAQENIKLINELATISTVRDQRTFDILKNLNISKHQLMLDPACFLNVPRIPKEKKIAINIAQHAPILGRFDGNQKGKNNRFTNLQLFISICKYLKYQDYKIIFIAHDALEQSLINDLQKEILDLEFINTDDIDIMLKEYSKCEFSIGIKMHSNILSFASGTPFISLYYDIKSIEYLKLLNWTDFGMSVFEDYYSWLHDKTRELIQSCSYYHQSFLRKKQWEKQKFDRLISDICKLI